MHCTGVTAHLIFSPQTGRISTAENFNLQRSNLLKKYISKESHVLVATVWIDAVAQNTNFSVVVKQLSSSIWFFGDSL